MKIEKLGLKVIKKNVLVVSFYTRFMGIYFIFGREKRHYGMKGFKILYETLHQIPALHTTTYFAEHLQTAAFADFGSVKPAHLHHILHTCFLTQIY